MSPKLACEALIREYKRLRACVDESRAEERDRQLALETERQQKEVEAA